MRRDPHHEETHDVPETSEDDGTIHNGTETDEQLDLESLQAELDAERRRSAEYLDQAQRARAEFVNYRRRTEEQQSEMQRAAGEQILQKVLPAFDDLSRAIETMEEEQRQTSWAEGFSLIQKKLWSALQSEGVQLIESLGQPFDPSQHDAVSMQEGGDGVPVVVQEFQRGYKLGDRVIRPAMVVVGPGDLLGDSLDNHDAQVSDNIESDNTEPETDNNPS